MTTKMQRAGVVLCAMALLVTVADAQFGLFGSPPTPVQPGAGKSVIDVICADPQLGFTCRVARAAPDDPTVTELADPTFTGTIFAPTDEAWQSSKNQLQRALAVQSIDVIPTEPNIAARVLAAHVIVGQALQFSQLQNDQVFRNALGQNLEVDTGILYGKYIKGPKNTVRLRESQDANNIPAARSYIHKVTDVIIPG